MSAQDALVALIAALALTWLVARWWRARRRGDSACASCPSATAVPGVRPAPQPQVLLGIDEPARPGGDRDGR